MVVRKKKSMDANNAAAWVSTLLPKSRASIRLPPSSPMADYVDQWSAQGQKNIFGNPVKVIEMQSEAGAAGMVHGSSPPAPSPPPIPLPGPAARDSQYV